MPAPLVKRGGARRPIRKQRKRPQTNPETFYRETRNKGILSKKTSQYRYLIISDLEPDDLAGLYIFSSWIKTNINVLDQHNNFPIYGMIIGDSEAKHHRAVEYIGKLAVDLDVLDEDSNLYNSVSAAMDRVWTNTSPSIEIDSEDQLVPEDAPPLDPKTFDFDYSLKPENFIVLWTKKNCEFDPKFTEWLSKTQIISNLELPYPNVINCQTQISDYYLSPKNARAFFRKIDDPEDNSFAEALQEAIYIFNNYFEETIAEEFEEHNETKDIDFSNPEETQSAYNDLFTKQTELKPKFDLLQGLQRYDGKLLKCSGILTVVGLLSASGKITTSPFTVKNKKLVTGPGAMRFLEGMLCASLDILDDF